MVINTRYRHSSLARSRTRTNSSTRGRLLQSSRSAKSPTARLSSSAAKKVLNKYASTKTSNTSSKSSVSDSKKMDLYTDIENSAKKLQTAASKLMQTGEKSLFQTTTNTTETATEANCADENTSEKETTEKAEDVTAVEEIKNFIKAYNSMVESMTESGDTVNKVYLASLKSEFASGSKSLKKVGITINSDGTLKKDDKILESASLDDLEKIFGAQSTMMKRIVKYTSSIQNNANKMVTKLESQSATKSYNYNRYGNTVNSYYNSSYNYSG